MRTRTATDRLAGWGATNDSVALVCDTPDHAAVIETVAGTQGNGAHANGRTRGVVARGGGSASGDSARNGGGRVITLSGPLTSTRSLRLDWESRTATVMGGARLRDLIPQLLRQGWFLPVTPDTTMATVAGCIATDAHGRNHADAGSFGSQVRALELVDGSGQLRQLRPAVDPRGAAASDARDAPDGPRPADSKAFWGTVGGLGLTGVVTRAVLDVVAVSTAWVVIDSHRCDGLDEVMARLQVDDVTTQYRMARLDPTAPAAALGRGVVTTARHAGLTELPAARRDSALEFELGTTSPPMRLIPSKLLGSRSVRAFHETAFRLAPRERRDELQPLAEFLFADDTRNGLGDWYASANVVQYQFVVPDCAADLVAVALERLAETGVPPVRAQLRRFGPTNPGPLSFAIQGWALDLHVAASTPDVAWILDSLDELVAAAGGRVRLAKDDRLRPELLSTMYPRLPEWQRVRQSLDPDRHLQSDLARRLAL